MQSTSCKYSLTRTSLLVLAIFVFVAGQAKAGGFHISNTLVNNRPVSPLETVVVSSREVDLCYSISGYSYSSSSSEREYILFVVAEAHRPFHDWNLPAANVVVRAAREPDPSEAENNLVRCTRITIPESVNPHVVYYLPVPLFSRSVDAVGSVAAEELPWPQQVEVIDHVRRYSDTLSPLAQLKLTTGKAMADAAQTYLRLNGRAPSLQSAVEGGTYDEPATFSWFSRPDNLAYEYSYRVYPDEIDWSPWAPATSWKSYYFGIGTHVFQVRTRVRGRDGQFTTLPVAYYQFFLEKSFIAGSKAESRAVDTTVTSSVHIDQLYRRSRALLIGIPTYADARFQALPWVATDVHSFADVLKDRGFVVETPKVDTKASVMKAITSFIEGSGKDDRVLVYVSSHGFQDEDGVRGYIVTRDCKKDEPWTCIALTDLDTALTDEAKKRGVKHTLLIVDACASGLGVQTKASAFPEIAVAARQASHIMTAGTGDEYARPTQDGTMSIFTKYLVDGLKGSADLIPDRTISLSELLVYVRWNVAKATGGGQTPTVGLLSGRGEMLFPLQ